MTSETIRLCPDSEEDATMTNNLEILLEINPRALDAKAQKAEVVIINLLVDYHSFFFMN